MDADCPFHFALAASDLRQTRSSEVRSRSSSDDPQNRRENLDLDQGHVDRLDNAFIFGTATEFFA
jgi:hypothetical protein